MEEIGSGGGMEEEMEWEELTEGGNKMEWGRTRSQGLGRNNRGRQRAKRAKRAARERLELGLKKLRARSRAWLGLNNCEPEPSRAELDSSRAGSRASSYFSSPSRSEA